MIVFPSSSSCAKNVLGLNRSIEAHMGSKLCNVVSRRMPSSCRLFSFPRNSETKYSHLSVSKNIKYNPTYHGRSYFASCFSEQKAKLWSLAVKELRRTHVKISLANHSMSMRLLVPSQRTPPKMNYNKGTASASLICGLLVCHSSSEPVHAEAARDEDDDHDCGILWHGKRVFTDYSITGIPGDGRCLFRSVAHGACLRRGESAPCESRQRELADDLRARVADEFVKRRAETEWFVEGDFDKYVSQIRKPHIWGGEPELFMASHVLQMPITVYMHEREAGGLIAIAEYGQEYGKHNPIRVLYHGFGHYDALQIPDDIKSFKSRL